MKNLYLLLFFLLLFFKGYSQRSDRIFTSDIDHFWMAFDSIQQVDDYPTKLDLINRLYIEPGSKGLHAFMEARDYSDSLFVHLIEAYPKYWNSVRSNTLLVNSKLKDLEKGVERLADIYPDLREAEMYFTIGGLRSGGTVDGNMVLVGAEIATADANTDVSEFENDWLKNVFAKQSPDNLVYLNIHEYIHTQQTGSGKTVLSQSIHEGACDFLAELVLDEPIQTQYMAFGRLHEEVVKRDFEIQMFSSSIGNWLYNGSQKGEKADLGYYVGYEICKSFYENSTDKSLAIKEIIELDFDDEEKVVNFLNRSKYFPFPVNREKVIAAYQEACPEVLNIGPFENGSHEVDPTTTELKINFSKEMEAGSMSISLSEDGEPSTSDKAKSNMPLKGVKGFENDGKTLVLELSLEANREYEFLVTNKGFRSKDGYPLRQERYLVRFKTND